jgi:hypothetical protein
VFILSISLQTLILCERPGERFKAIEHEDITSASSSASVDASFIGCTCVDIVEFPDGEPALTVSSHSHNRSVV